MTVNLGPVLLNGFFSGKTGFDYNPRCLRRDISKWVAHRWTKTSDIISLLLHHHHISSFQTTMQGEMEKGSLGVHGGGHFTVGGDPGGVSPSVCFWGPISFSHSHSHGSRFEFWSIWWNLIWIDGGGGWWWWFKFSRISFAHQVIRSFGYIMLWSIDSGGSGRT